MFKTRLKQRFIVFFLSKIKDSGQCFLVFDFVILTHSTNLKDKISCLTLIEFYQKNITLMGVSQEFKWKQNNV